MCPIFGHNFLGFIKKNVLLHQTSESFALTSQGVLIYVLYVDSRNELKAVLHAQERGEVRDRDET